MIPNEKMDCPNRSIRVVVMVVDLSLISLRRCSPVSMCRLRARCRADYLLLVSILVMLPLWLFCMLDRLLPLMSREPLRLFAGSLLSLALKYVFQAEKPFTSKASSPVYFRQAEKVSCVILLLGLLSGFSEVLAGM